MTSESKIERVVTAWARDMGLMTIKLNVRGQRGTPDRLFMLNGRVLFLEFKRPGAKPSPLQRYMITQLQANGFDAVVVDEVEQAKKLIGRYLLGWCT